MADNVRLRAVREADIETFYEYEADPESAALADFASRDRDTLAAHWHRIMADDAKVARTIVVDDRVAGHIGCWEAEGHHEVGYWVGREFWGRGVATAALGQLLEIVDGRPLEAWIAPHNAGSMRVVEKNGFVFDRVDDDHHVFVLRQPARPADAPSMPDEDRAP